MRLVLSYNHPRSHMLRNSPRIENFQSDLEEASSLPNSLKNWLESTISISRTTSQDSHLCSNPTATVTDGASERSSEKSYKIVTHDDFFIADETAGRSLSVASFQSVQIIFKALRMIQCYPQNRISTRQFSSLQLTLLNRFQTILLLLIPSILTSQSILIVPLTLVS